MPAAVLGCRVAVKLLSLRLKLECKYYFVYTVFVSIDEVCTTL